MIKNIPNKYSQKMLLAAVDERHKGQYDFFYLPIDFKVSIYLCFLNTFYLFFFFRTSATSDMPSSILLIVMILYRSMKNSMGRDGRSSTARRSVRSPMLVSRFAIPFFFSFLFSFFFSFSFVCFSLSLKRN